MKKKKIITSIAWVLGLIALAILATYTFLFIKPEKMQSGSRIIKGPIRYDSQKLLDSFPLLDSIESCIWMSITLSSDMPGPSIYLVKAVIKTDEKTINQLLNDYSWEPAIVQDMPEEFDIWMSQYSDCAWLESSKFNNSMDGNRYLGSYYISVQEKLLYIDTGII